MARIPCERTVEPREIDAQVKGADGAAAVLRPITPDDAAALVNFHATLSSDTTHMRFFNVHPHLSETEVRHFTHVDHHDREAIVVIAEAAIIGVGRLDRIPDSTDAEVAFVVSDTYQNHGIGTALLMRLADHARSEGVQRLLASTLCENRAMIAVFNHSGFNTVRTRDHGVYQYEMVLGAKSRD